MSQELHARAERLIAQERVEGISSADQQWLRQHLSECARCVARAAATEQAIRSLRGLSVALPPTLASRTQFRVRLRAEQLRSEPRCTAWACRTSCGNSALDFGGRCPPPWSQSSCC